MNQFRSRAAIGSLFFMHGLCFSSWASRIPAIQEKMQMSEAQLGSILFAIPIGSVLSMPVAAWLVSRVGSRQVLIFAILLYACFLVTLGLAATKLQLLVLLMLFGLVSNMVNVSLNTQAVRSEALYERPIMASFHGLWSVAGFFGAAIGVAMIGANVPPLWHFMLIFSAIAAGLVVSSRHLLTDTTHATPGQARAFVLPDRSLLGLGLICFCVMVCEGMMFDWSGIYFAKVLHAEGSWIGAGYVAFMTTMASTRFVADGFKARFGLAKVLRLSGITIFAGLMTSVLFPALVTSIIGFFMVGSGVSAVVPLVMSEAGQSKKMSPSAAIAAVSTIGFLGFVVGPPVIGWIASATSLRVSFAIVALLGLSIIALTLSKSTRADSASAEHTVRTSSKLS
jgi:MFS family permease